MCAAKHVARAKVLMGETFLGYPEHYFDALGEMSMAETELVQSFPDVAATVRSYRLLLQDNALAEINWWPMYNALLDAMRDSGNMPKGLTSNRCGVKVTPC
jgi:hypothetical protein